jgi:hypothetical protein
MPFNRNESRLWRQEKENVIPPTTYFLSHYSTFTTSAANAHCQLVMDANSYGQVMRIPNMHINITSPGRVVWIYFHYNQFTLGNRVFLAKLAVVQPVQKSLAHYGNLESISVIIRAGTF